MINDNKSASLRRTILAGIAGNVMEWYDFAVYGYFVASIGKHFFPSTDELASVIAAFGAFAAGFLMRPIGGLIFGHIGDRVGRQTALTLSVLAMAIPTFLIGVLPDCAQIGRAATVLMVALRMIQGLSVGGEYTTSVVFLVERGDQSRRGLMGSWSVFGAVAGILLGSATGAVINSVLPPEQVRAWGWRIPFILGLAVGLIGLYIRRHLPETSHHAPGEKPARMPVVDAFRTEWRSMLKIAGFCAMNGVGFYMMFVYAVTYLRTVVHVSAAKALYINTANMFVMLLLTPLAGALSDKLGRKPLLVFATGGTVLFAWPLLWMMHHQNDAFIFFGQLGFAVLIGVFLGVGPAMMVEAFPARVRCSAFSIGYNISLAVLGGTAPIVSAYLVRRTHQDLAPAFYLMCAATLSLAVTLTMKEKAVATARAE